MPPGEQDEDSEGSSGDEEQESEDASGDQEQESEGSSGDQEQESEEASGRAGAGYGGPPGTRNRNPRMPRAIRMRSRRSLREQEERATRKNPGKSRKIARISRKVAIQTSRIDEKGGNLPIDKSDKGAGSEGRRRGPVAMKRSRKTPEFTPGQAAGQAGTPEELSEEEAVASEAVDRFDQMGTGQGEADQDAPTTGVPDEEAIAGTGIPIIMMEQWLEQIEGDPAFLLRNQFLIEERRQLEQRGSMLMESRPW